MNFLALDVETANPDLASICQIGIVRFRDGKPAESWSSLIDPEDFFDGINVSMHGIDEDTVRGAPTWQSVIDHVRALTNEQIVISHGAFDRASTTRASAKHGVQPLACQWLDSCRIARRAWADVARKGYGLAPLAERFGITFAHHDAEEDAAAAGMIVVRAIQDTGLGLDAWIQRVRQPINPEETPTRHATPGNPEGPLHGETIVFTGALCIPRREAARLAALAGCDVSDGVTKHTTILVVGDTDIRKLHGKEKSAKHQKAEALINKGAALRIVSETDFANMANIK